MAKLTEAQRYAMKRVAEALEEYVPPCPWNPFPLSSEWGRMIEDGWRREQLRRRREGRRALAGGEQP